MTEQPDTTAIRAGIFGNPAKVIYDLCDALDAVRVERANWRKAAEDEAAWRRDWHRRAEAAEAQCVLNSGEYAALERICGEFQDASREKSARIAAALAILRQFGFTDTEMAIIALTEGTVQ